MKPISPHVLQQVRDVMVQHFGPPPWDQAHALFADDMAQTLQATTDVAEMQEDKAKRAEAKIGRLAAGLGRIGQALNDALTEASKP